MRNAENLSVQKWYNLFHFSCSDSIALSAERHTLSDVVPKNASIGIDQVAAVDDREFKQKVKKEIETPTDFINNSKSSKKESKIEIKSKVKNSIRKVTQVSAQQKSISQTMVLCFFISIISCKLSGRSIRLIKLKDILKSNGIVERIN